MPKRGPGRPRKNAASPAQSPVKRGPGRPPKNAASPASVKSPKPAPASSVSPALIGRSSGGVSRSMSNLRSPPPREREAKLGSPIAKSGRKPSRSMTNPHNDDPPQRLSRVAPSGGAASSGAKSSARKRPSAKGTSSKSKRPRPIKDAQGHLRYIVAEVVRQEKKEDPEDGRRKNAYLVRWEGYSAKHNSWIFELPEFFRK